MYKKKSMAARNGDYASERTIEARSGQISTTSIRMEVKSHRRQFQLHRLLLCAKKNVQLSVTGNSSSVGNVTRLNTAHKSTNKAKGETTKTAPGVEGTVSDARNNNNKNSTAHGRWLSKKTTYFYFFLNGNLRMFWLGICVVSERNIYIYKFV